MRVVRSKNNAYASPSEQTSVGVVLATKCIQRHAAAEVIIPAFMRDLSTNESVFARLRIWASEVR